MTDGCDGCQSIEAERAELGRRLFEDKNLSASGAVSCQSCHEPGQAFTGNHRDADELFPVAVGAFDSRLGQRNAPTAMYAAFTPSFSIRPLDDEGEVEQTPLGGQFWDGRADTLEQQATAPFLNPREMALADKRSIVERVAAAEYAPLFQSVFGNVLSDIDVAYAKITEAIAAFERTDRFTPFSSKFDAVLRGTAELSASEARGFELFKDANKGNCIACHVGNPGSRDPNTWLFTDFTYDNLGVPRNPRVPDNADPEFFDLGLCQQPGLHDRLPAQDDPEAFVASLCGAFKVPTLRNVARTAPYMHNGYFQTLRDVVDFYVTRDTDPGRWYPVDQAGQVVNFNDVPQGYRVNVNTKEVPYGRHPGEVPYLSPAEIDDVVAFLETLSDSDP